MASRLYIRTHLDAGIYQSDRDRVASTLYSPLRATPRNLLAIIRALHDHRRTMVQGYGNIGAGHSWVEIDGTRISPDDLEWIETPREMGDYREALQLAANLLVKRDAAATLGRLGGSVASEAQKAAARENGKRGGRPRKSTEVESR